MQYKLILRILISFTARVGCMLILSVILATPGSRIAAWRLTVLATLSGATRRGHYGFAFARELLNIPRECADIVV